MPRRKVGRDQKESKQVNTCNIDTPALCAFVSPNFLYMCAGILVGVKPTDCLPGQFANPRKYPATLPHVKAVHYLATPLYGNYSPHENNAQCFGDFADNTIRGTLARSLNRVLFAMLSDNAIGCPTMCPISDVQTARAVSDYLHANYAPNAHGPLSAMSPKVSAGFDF